MPRAADVLPTGAAVFWERGCSPARHGSIECRSRVGIPRRCGVEMKAIKPIQAEWGRRLLVVVSARQIARFLGAAVVATWAALLGLPAATAFAQPCPDVEVVFARGTYEPPGVGMVGQAFVDSLRSQAGGRPVGVYGVDYAASGDFPPPGDLQRQAYSLSAPSSTGFTTREIMSRPRRRTARTPGVGARADGRARQGAGRCAGFVTSADIRGGSTC